MSPGGDIRSGVREGTKARQEGGVCWCIAKAVLRTGTMTSQRSCTGGSKGEKYKHKVTIEEGLLLYGRRVPKWCCCAATNYQYSYSDEVVMVVVLVVAVARVRSR